MIKDRLLSGALICFVAFSFNVVGIAGVSAAEAFIPPTYEYPAQTLAMRGIFAINAVHPIRVGHSMTPQIDASMLASSNVDGVAIQVPWSSIETTDGAYAWSTALDGLISQLQAVHKTAILDVLPGWEAPTWLYSEGVRQFKFVWDKPWGPGECQVVSIPIPWDPIYLARWEEFINTLGRRYQNNSTIAGVIISGVNSEDEETALPFWVNKHISGGRANCIGNDNVTDWQQAGYTRTSIESAWQQIMEAYQQAFPSKTLITVLEIGGFPPIDNFGNVFTGSFGQDQQVSTDLLALGSSQLAAQFGAQNDGLSSVPNSIWSSESAYANQYTTGYQTVRAMGSSLATAMNLALGAGASYMELYETDLNMPSNQAAITSTRSQLLSQ